MLTGISHSYVWVEDHDRALSFYTGKLGFEIREDVRVGTVRWVTVGHPVQPYLRVALIEIDSALDEEAAAAVHTLQSKGAINGGGLSTGDCRATHQDLAAKGVTFVQEPADRPYGVEAIFKDDSGNLWGMVELWRSAE